MLTSIHPLGERARGQRFGVTLTAYLVGSAGGGLVLGALAGTVGVLTIGASGPTPLALAVAAVVTAAVAGAELRGRSPLPGPRRQVDEDWLVRYRGWVYGLGFGVQLGAGVATIVTSATVYLMVGLAVLTGSLLHAATIGMAFGIGRALPMLAVAGVETPDQLRAVQRRIIDSAARVRRTSAIVLFVLAGLLGGAAVAAA